MFLNKLWDQFMGLNDFFKIGVATLLGIPAFIWLVKVALETVLHLIYWPLSITMGFGLLWLLAGFIYKARS